MITLPGFLQLHVSADSIAQRMWKGWYDCRNSSMITLLLLSPASFLLLFSSFASFFCRDNTKGLDVRIRLAIAFTQLQLLSPCFVVLS